MPTPESPDGLDENENNVPEEPRTGVMSQDNLGAPMALRTGMIQLNVTDLAEARAFYGETLGIALGEDFGPEAPFELDLGAGPTVLVYHVTRSRPVDYGEETGVTLVLYTNDLDVTVARWRERGVEFIPIAWAEEESGIAECPYGRFIAFRDPFGNVLELLQPHR